MGEVLMINKLRFECYRCPHCCFFKSEDESPIVFEDETTDLRLEATRFGVELKFVDMGGGLFRWVINGFCPFYNTSEHYCSIHSKKPLSCKIYPLLLNIKTGNIHISTACEWVVRNLSNLLNEEINLEEVFKDEVNWIIILYKKLLSS